MSDDGSHSSRQSSSPSPPPTLPTAHLDVDTELCKIIPSRGIEIGEKKSMVKVRESGFRTRIRLTAAYPTLALVCLQYVKEKKILYCIF